MSFSDKLVKLRNKRNLTQEQFAKAIGLSRSAISMYESGKREPNFETLELLADFFNVNMDYLLDSKKPANAEPSQNTLKDDDVATLIAAAHRKVKEQHKDDPNSEEYWKDIQAINVSLQKVFEGKFEKGVIPPIIVTEEAEQLLIIRYRTLDKERQNELTKRANELCELYSLHVDMDKVHNFGEMWENTPTLPLDIKEKIKKQDEELAARENSFLKQKDKE